MFPRCFSKEPSAHSTIRLQHAIQDYKKQLHDKSTLERKLHILKNKCENNKKKNKNVMTQLQKIKTVKESYLKGKLQIEIAHSIDAQQRVRKVRRQKTLREQSKENIHIIRNMLSEERNTRYHQIKQKEYLNQIKINQNLQKSLNQKRQKSLQVKLKEEEGRLSRTLYFEKKRMRTQKQSEVELSPIQTNTQITKQYIKQMKLLEQEMTCKLRQSQLNLSSSKMSLCKIMK